LMKGAKAAAEWQNRGGLQQTLLFHHLMTVMLSWSSTALHLPLLCLARMPPQ
jgi:hypothetical protein